MNANIKKTEREATWNTPKIYYSSNAFPRHISAKNLFPEYINNSYSSVIERQKVYRMTQKTWVDIQDRRYTNNQQTYEKILISFVLREMKIKSTRRNYKHTNWSKLKRMGKYLIFQGQVVLPPQNKFTFFLLHIIKVVSRLSSQCPSVLLKNIKDSKDFLFIWIISIDFYCINKEDYEKF